MDPRGRLDRRHLLLAGAGLLAATVSACTAGEEAPQPARRTTPGGPSTASGTTTPPTTGPATTPTRPASTDPSSQVLPDVEPWSPSPGDVLPEVKLAAVRVVEAIGSWPPGAGGPRHAAARLRSLGQDGRLAVVPARPMHTGAPAAALEVIEAQYGGLSATTASVLVVCRQWHLDASGVVVPGGTTVDVRLTKDSPRWRVTAMRPGHLPPPARSLPPLARDVLGEPRIDLPPAAVADIASGAVHDSVLTALLRLARVYQVGISVIRSGHPTYVFGTDRPSAHPLGRAFDTWRIDGRPVVDPSTPRDLVTGYMHAVANAGSDSVGGPVLLAGPPGRFFSDATHHDHIHAGFAT